MIKITASAYKTLKKTVGTLPPETGAVIGTDDLGISRVWFDEQAGIGQKSYRPSCGKAEEIIRGWIKEGYGFAGIVHSHTENYPSLSPMDVRSAVVIMQVNHMSSILLGLFCKGELAIYQISGGMDGSRPSIEKKEYQII